MCHGDTAMKADVSKATDGSNNLLIGKYRIGMVATPTNAGKNLTLHSVRPINLMLVPINNSVKLYVLLGHTIARVIE